MINNMWLITKSNNYLDRSVEFVYKNAKPIEEILVW